jgi:hypothetical protein
VFVKIGRRVAYRLEDLELYLTQHDGLILPSDG